MGCSFPGEYTTSTECIVSSLDSNDGTYAVYVDGKLIGAGFEDSYPWLNDDFDEVEETEPPVLLDLD